MRTVETKEITSDVKAAYDDLEQFDADQRYIDAHYEELHQANKNKWIAVHEGAVVAVGSNLEELRTALEAKDLLLENVARRKLINTNLLPQI